MKKILVTLIILLIVGVGAFYLLRDSDTNATDNINQIDETITGVKTFVMTGENFKFVMNGADNPDIIVNKGDTIRIEFTSTQGFHDWVVDEFNAATTQVRDTDGSTFVEFTADNTGTFEYYCSVGQHRANGMKGNLIVQ